MIQLTPPMGWNQWNTFGPKVDEALIRQIADSMVNTGLLAAGYNYLVVDDCWSEKERDAQQRLVASHEKFPSGMKALGDYIHSKGLKFGMYSCVSEKTCGGYPGSFNHEFIDAETFAEWGVDFLKLDYCFKAEQEQGHLLYKRMGAALANCGRDILFSACSWGEDDTKSWIKSTGAHMWRSTLDLEEEWGIIKGIALQQIALQPYNARGCFNDMDMLAVGMEGKGYKAISACAYEEYRTHFSLWALLNSPLMIGCDIRNMSDNTKTILFNKDIIAINQDIGGYQPYLLNKDDNSEALVWAKLLDNGDFAIGLFNLSDTECVIGFELENMGLNKTCGKTLSLRNLWTHDTFTIKDRGFKAAIKPHDCIIFRANLINI